MYHCDDCGREGTPRMVGRVLVCTCGSVELRWLPVVARPAAALAERVCGCDGTIAEHNLGGGQGCRVDQEAAP